MKYFFVCLFLFAIVLASFAQDNMQILYGKATYYHKRFEGRKTANGEKFSQKQYTCAHKSLPINTFLKVTNLENDKTIVLRVNDRLPKKSKVLLDLSFIAAQKLDFIKKGSADIRAEVIDPKNIHDSLSTLFAEAAKGMKIEKKKNVIYKCNTPVVFKDTSLIVQNIQTEIFKNPNNIEKDTLIKKCITTLTPFNYGIQVLSYNSQERAQLIADRLMKQYNESVSVKPKEIKGKMYYRVIIGQYASKPELFALKSKLAKEYKDCYAMALD